MSVIHRSSCGGVVKAPDGRIAVASQHGSSWCLPKGGREQGETELEAARREVLEETGISELTLVKELGKYTRHGKGLDGNDEPNMILHLTFFLFTTEQTTLKPIDPHNPEAVWKTPEEAVELLSFPEDKAFLRSVLDQI
jgi:8-oxo-dGTP pyrophosphatase MutT (NUDIX family)